MNHKGENVPVKNLCNGCGAELLNEARGGFCARCLFGAAVRREPEGAPESGVAEGNGSELEATPKTNNRRFGDYELLEEIARGGMGIVYKARQVSLDRLVAIKMLLLGGHAGPEFVQRFRNEASAAASLQHPNIVAIHEVGFHESQHFLAMDYVDGPDLARFMQNQPLPARRAAGYVKTLAEAIHYAHERRILHRDLKPSNVLIDSNDQPRVTDFGLAKRLTDPQSETPDPQLTLTGQVLGTPSFISPEQASARRGQVGPTTDVYALGAILYHALTGRPPFMGETLADTLQQVLHNEPIAPRLLQASIPPDLQTICLKSLEKEPSKRFRSAQLLAEELGRFLRQEPIFSRPVGKFERTWRWCRRNPLMATTVVLGTLIAVGAPLAVWWLRTSQVQARLNAAQAWPSGWSHAKNARAVGTIGRKAIALNSLKGAAKARQQALLWTDTTLRRWVADTEKSGFNLRGEVLQDLSLTDLEAPVFWRQAEPGTRFDTAMPDADFQRFAVCHERGGLSLHVIPGGTELARVETPPHQGAHLVFSPDGQWLAAQLSGGRLFLFNTASEGKSKIQNLRSKINESFPPVFDGPHTASFSPDSRTLAFVTTNGLIHFYPLVPAKEPAPLNAGPGVFGIAYHPGGLELAVMTAGAVQVWNLAHREKTTSLKHGGISNTALDWSPYGDVLAIGYKNGDLLVWNPLTEMTRDLTGLVIAEVKTLLFDSKGEFLASVTADGRSQFWDPVGPRALWAAADAGDWFCLQASRDGRHLAFRREAGSLGAWRIDRSRVFRALRSPGGQLSELSSVTLSRDGAWLAFAGTDRWHLWALDAKEQTSVEPEEVQAAEAASVPATNVNCVQFDPAGRYVVGVTPDRVLRWPVDLKMPGARPSFSRQSLLTRVPANPGVGPAETLLDAPGSELQRAAVSQSGRRLAVVGHKRSFVLSLDDPGKAIEFGAALRDVSGLNPEPFTSLDFVSLSPDGRWVAAGGVEGVAVWDAADARLLVRLLTNAIAQIAFNSDGRTLATATADECVLWNTTNWTMRRHLPLVPGATAQPIAFGPDPNVIACPANAVGASLWDIRDGKWIVNLGSPLTAQRLESLVWSADGRYVAAPTIRGLVYLWDMRAMRKELAAMGLDW